MGPGVPRLNRRDPINNGLVSYLPMGGGTLQSVTQADLTGADYHGTLSGGWSLAPGLFGQATTFDGSTGGCVVNNAGAMPVFAPLTVCCWVLLPLTSDGVIISRWDAATTGFCWLLTPTDFYSQIAGGTTIYHTSQSAPASGWHHFAGTVDGSSLYMYLDGVQSAAGTNIGFPGGPLASVSIGTRDTATPLFTGITINQVRIYNRALDPSEIQRMANDTTGTLGLILPPKLTWRGPISASPFTWQNLQLGQRDPVWAKNEVNSY